MKRIILLVVSMMVLALAGCGSEVSVVIPIPVPIITPPSITYSQYTQDTVNRFVDGSVDFYAPYSDIDTITITVVDSRGFVVERAVTPVPGLTGITTGTISFSIDYLLYRPDTYTFSVYLTDRAGYFSNVIYGTFRV
ncbi:MAG: hypothetical protein IPQ16_07165 [Geobacteraceae bacterium]|nr:hypothetical protein [Geobacteraceae bacterium]